MGPLLLYQLYVLAPRFLFYSVFAGWVAYSAAAAGVVAKNRPAHYVVILLALLVLVLSLPQPEHYSFFYSGDYLAALTFLVGDLLQVLVILFTLLVIREKRWF